MHTKFYSEITEGKDRLENIFFAGKQGVCVFVCVLNKRGSGDSRIGYDPMAGCL